MKVRYVNQQDKFDPMNRNVIGSARELAELLDQRRNRAPFMADLVADNGFELLLGIGPNVGCAQYSRADGEPPYLMAVSPERHMRKGCVEFFVSNTPTPVAARYILSFDQLKAISLYFFETGDRSNAVSWCKFDPGAAKEDAQDHR
jgi:hypothetical protein